MGRLGQAGLLLGLLALSGAAGLSASAGAEAPVPFGDSPVRLLGDPPRLSVAAIGLSSGAGPAARRSAAAQARQRAHRALHRHVDDVLARAGAAPRAATAVHEALRGAVVEVGARPLADGSLVVRVEAPTAPLSAAWPGEELSWAP